MMGIAEEIALVERDFIPGEVLLAALTLQEGVFEYQAASWFSRNIRLLNLKPMLSFNYARRDFRRIETAWGGDVFRDIAGEFLHPTSWDEDEDDYIGGWLSSDLKSFFSQTTIKYPELAIQTVLKNKITLSAKPEGSSNENHLSEQNDVDEIEPPTLATRERCTLLTIIAALAGEAKVSVITPSKTAELIADMTQKMGAAVAKRTIEEHLKKIPDALERRMK